MESEKTEVFSYSLWFVPAHPLHDMLGRIIAELAQRFGTTAFTPHATLCSGKWEGGLDDLKCQVDRLSSSLQPTTMATAGIDCGDKKTTFFYLKLDNKVATPVFTHSQRALSGSHAPEIGAHLSLMYAEPNANIDRKSLADELAGRMPRQIDFDQLQVVTPAGKGANTEQWQMRHAVRLIPVAN